MRLIFRQFRHFFVGLTMVGCGVLTMAQTPRQPTGSPNSELTSGGTIRGRVVLPGGGFVSEGLRISLQTIRGTDSTVFTDNTGRFEFTRLNPGRYQVIVEPDPRMYETATESIEVVRGTLAVLNIVLKAKAATGR